MNPVPPYDWIIPDWPSPSWVRAISTTRQGGVSEGCYASLNLGDHVEDRPDHVAANRQQLRAALDLPAEPLWLRQVHGRNIVLADQATPGVEGDGAQSRTPGQVCAVLTADCLPVLLCDRAGTRVAAVHAGWRGLAEGVIESAIESLELPGSTLLAWLGPAIGPHAFEVGAEVHATFVAHDAAAVSAFQPQGKGGGERWHANLYQLARQRLAAHGITEVYGGEYCTYTDSERFFSYRRDGRTGRMATLIWMSDRED